MGTLVANSWRKYVTPCWRPSVLRQGENCSNKVGDPSGRADKLWWYKDIGLHMYGELSMAVIQANNVLEDQCQVESGPMSYMEAGPQGTFVGIYDGHAGPEASRFINNHLLENIKRYTFESREMSADVIKNAYLATEEQFLSMVKKQWEIKPQIASVGSCCLVGVVCDGMIYTANAGDSRVVLAAVEKSGKQVKAIQLSDEHNASVESVREELRSLHPEDPKIVVLKHNVWRVKGVIQISRSIGDAYLKSAEFNKPPLIAKFRIPDPFEKPILLAEPSIHVHKLQHGDQFLIYASDGLWEHLSNQDAVNIVHHSPRNGIAKRLVKAALKVAAKKREMRYSDLKKIDRGVRRHFHDDITVIVLFLDSHLISQSSFQRPVLLVKGSGVAPGDADA
ncbi:probable protein phosphatase 2C 38 isoform X1 [Salvia splendens]|uniref:probable protein phosphatase 2C 38 isoform X1 n=1 Tax=Salvia splendens TaxID=180675 RepID=UPI001C276060|nr:probable protein phosphatase 2C 38 isoform X1 [Salvia splendens]XP_042004378.1 probable protein phosphatase 2C 38 isoform X1 [Salvia splendens]XP_042004379.1 probable protein phosphatase 2C 38 isoform X1 [Salvia splendens]